MLHLIPLQTVTLPAIAIVWLGLVGFLFAAFAARRRQRAGGADVIARRRSASLGWIALQGVGFGIAAFGPIRIASDVLAPVALLRDLVVLLLVTAMVWLFHASSSAMGKNWALVARTRDDHELVQTGPFAYVRHPIYVALFCYVVALAVAYGHLASLILAVPVYWFATWMRIRHEEAILHEQFGPAYEAYAARVKRFVPGVI